MFLKRLKLTNFRNYQDLDFEFKTPTVILYGNNAQGKSNFLESIFILSTTKSPKAQKEEELVKNSEEVARLEGLVVGDNQEEVSLEIAMQLSEGFLSKRVKVNGVARRILDYIGSLSVVLFAPEDINLVTGSPSLRRWHVDLTLAQIDKDYKKALTVYGEVITKRNKILKSIQEGQASLEELLFWSDEMILQGGIVSQKREEFFNFLNNIERKFGDFQFIYKQSSLSKERLNEYHSREIASATCLVGPHRDDFTFSLNSQDLSRFGSRGEQRSAVLDLKVAEVEFIEKQTKERPILLLDDVFSELDPKHRAHVVSLAKLQQTVIATVELQDDVIKELNEAGIFLVKEGEIVKNEQATRAQVHKL